MHSGQEMLPFSEHMQPCLLIKFVSIFRNTHNSFHCR